MTKRQKRIREALRESNVWPEKVICKRDGSVEVKKSYFYHHGQTCEKLAEKVKEVLLAGGLKVAVESRDDYATWPTTSYLVCIIR